MLASEHEWIGLRSWPHQRQRLRIFDLLNNTTMKTSIQQRVMHTAHLLYNYTKEVSCVSNVHPNWSASLLDAWAIQRVREAMQSGVVRLYFVKNNGEHVARVGTLCADYIPGSKMPKGVRDAEIEQGLTEPVWNVLNYYDLTKQGWRSFDLRYLQKAVPAKPVGEPRYLEMDKRLY